MTLENGYVIMRARYTRLVEEARRAHAISGTKRDKEHLEYLENRLKRYTI